MVEMEESAFSRVLSAFQSRLSPQDINRFRFTTYEDLKLFITDIQKEQAQRRGFRNLNRIRPFLNGLEQYGKVIEVFVNAKPDILAFVWGPIKLCLQIASKLTEAFDALLDAYERIGKSLPMFSMIDQLFHHPYVQQILVDVYEDILDFHKRAVVFFNQSAWKLTFKIALHTFGDMFGDVIKKLERSKELLLQSANIVHFQEAQDARLLFTREIENQAKKRNNDRTLAVIEWLSPASCNIDHEELQSMRREYPSTTRWIFKEPSLCRWFQTKMPATSTFWICGIPGAGKTVIFSAIVDEIRETVPDAQVIFFYCKNRDSTKNTFDSVARSLIAQLLQLNAIIFLDYLYEIAITSGQRHPSGFNAYTGIFENISTSHSHLFIGIDGLDECEEEERRLILSLLEHILKACKTQTNIKIFLGSQRMRDLETSLASATRFNIKDYHIQQDIQSYVLTRSLQLSKKFKFSPEKKESILTEISSRPKGMFLLARLIMDNLMDQDNLEDLEEELSPNTLPSGINEAYGRIMVRLCKGRSKKNQRRTAHILEIIITARRPLKIHEVQGALSIRLEDSSVDFAKRRSLTPLGDICGPIVETHADDTISLVHPTAKQYLVRYDNGSYINAFAAELRMANTCTKYLTLECFNGNLGKTDIRNHAILGVYAFQEYATLNWLYHSMPLLNSQIGVRLDKERIESGDSLREDLELLQKSCILLYSRHFKFYSQEFLTSEDFQEKIETVWEGSTQLRCLYESVPSISDGDDHDNSALYLLEHISKVRSTIEDLWGNTDYESFPLAEAYGKSPFKCSILSCPRFQDGFTSKESRDSHRASHRDRLQCPFEGCDYFMLGFTNNYELSKHLVEHRSLPDEAVFPKVRSCSLRKSLENAIDRNDILSVTTLSKEASTLLVQDHGFLLRAIKKGSLKAAKALLPILGTKEEFRHQDKSGKGAVVAAAENGDEELMNLMIENIACRTAITIWKAPLMAGAKRGNSGVVRLLLNNFSLDSGINLDVIRASIRLAVDGGHEEVLLILLDQGGEACAQHKEFYKAIIAAASQKRESVVRLLLEKGYKLNAVANYPASLRECAPKGIDAMVAQLMPKVGAMKEIDESVTLLSAASNGDLASISLLLTEGANPDEKLGPHFDRPLQAAAKMGHEAVVNLLLECGAEINPKDLKDIGVTPLYRAISAGHQRVVELLLDWGANINVDTFGETALKCAVRTNHKEIVCLLLERGATFTAINDYSISLQQAVDEGREAIIGLLVQWGEEKQELIHGIPWTKLEIAIYPHRVDKLEYSCC